MSPGINPKFLSVIIFGDLKYTIILIKSFIHLSTNANVLFTAVTRKVKWIQFRHIPYILEPNPHPNLVRTSCCRFLKRKNLIRTFPSTALAYKADWIILDVTNALTVFRLTSRVWSGHITASGTKAPQLMIVAGWRIAIQLWVMTASLMNNKL